MGSSTKGGKAKRIVTSFHSTFGCWLWTLTENYLPGSSVSGFLALLEGWPLQTLVGLVDGVYEAWVADRSTSHRCWPSRSAFQGWLCLDNTSQYRCWRWKPAELTEEEMFTAFVHCGTLELVSEREDRRSWSWRACTEATVKCFLKAKFSRIYSNHGSWYTFQIVVDDDELEMWLKWLENHEMGIDSNWRSCWHRFHGGGRCAERAWNLSLSWSAVLVYTSAWGSYQHVLVTLIMDNALESRACRHGTDGRCRLGY